MEGAPSLENNDKKVNWEELRESAKTAAAELVQAQLPEGYESLSPEERINARLEAASVALYYVQSDNNNKERYIAEALAQEVRSAEGAKEIYPVIKEIAAAGGENAADLKEAMGE